MKYVAFDLEISKVLPEGVTDIMAHRPLGISCAATLTSDNELRLWFSYEPPFDVREPQMTEEDCKDLAEYLWRHYCLGYQVVGWNSLGFDLNVLAEECRDPVWLVRMAKLAYQHIDPFLQMICEKGYGIGLQTAADGMHVEGKLEEVGGARAPEMWAKGGESQDKVLEYVAQDARVTAAVYDAIVDMGRLKWTSRSGRPQVWLPHFVPDDGSGPCRMLTVAEAMELPLPPTAWMTSARPREQYAGWMLDILDTEPLGGEEPPPDGFDLAESLR